MNTPQDVYIPVDGIKGSKYFILCKSDLSPINQLLEQKKNVYVFTPQEYKEQIDAAILLGKTLVTDFYKEDQIEKAIGDAITDALNQGHYSFIHPDLYPPIDHEKWKEQYLNNLKP